MKDEMIVDELCLEFPGFTDLTRGGKLAIRTLFEAALDDDANEGKTGDQQRDQAWKRVKKSLLKAGFFHVIGFLWDLDKIVEGTRKLMEIKKRRSIQRIARAFDIAMQQAVAKGRVSFRLLDVGPMTGVGGAHTGERGKYKDKLN